MVTKTESIIAVYNEKGEMVSVIQRDEKTGHHLVYLVEQAVGEDIAELIEKKDEIQGNKG